MPPKFIAGAMMTGPVHLAYHQRIIKEREVAGVRDDLASAAVHLTWKGPDEASPASQGGAKEVSWTWFPSGMKLALPSNRALQKTATCPTLKEGFSPEALKRSATLPAAFEIAEGPAISWRLPSMDSREASSCLSRAASAVNLDTKSTVPRKRPTHEELKSDLGRAASNLGASCGRPQASKDLSFFKQAEEGLSLRWRPSSSLNRRKVGGQRRLQMASSQDLAPLSLESFCRPSTSADSLGRERAAALLPRPGTCAVSYFPEERK
eukprot:TRINITY_DN62353_c0_g1_i1.p1 TRINITY_DN62353_c0_g1~~TRINITY_DN62353_c0_g1_i1.p1  ORF type:complete len:291 (-),score=58.68 TRINITY_DN62353_c0_g1_i1:10-804(-)